LDGADSSFLQINDLVTEGKSKLLGLQLPRDIGAGERPVKDGDRAGKHTLHWLGGQALGVATPFDGHRVGAADIGDNDGGADVT